MLLCAPTGRAAKRMSEATGSEAKTIHRLLEVDPRAPAGGFRRDGENSLDCGLLSCMGPLRCQGGAGRTAGAPRQVLGGKRLYALAVVTAGSR